MIRPRHVQYLAALALDRTPNENPVQLTKNDVRPGAPVAQGAAKTCLAQPRNQPRVEDKGVEVAGDDDGSLRWIALSIFENLFELLQA